MFNKAEFAQILMDPFLKLKKFCLDLTLSPNSQDNELYIFKLGASKLNIFKFKDMINSNVRISSSFCKS